MLHLTRTGPHDDLDPAIERARLSRRRMLLGTAAAGGALALGAVPGVTGLVGAQEDGPPDPALPPDEDGAPPGEPLHGEDAPVGPDDDQAGRSVEGRSFDQTLAENPNRQIAWPLPSRPNNSSTWTNTYNACRGTGCSRRHQGQDLMAPRMTPIVSVVSGTIVEFRHRAQPAGNSLYVRGDDGWFYCYLHINNDNPNASPVNNDQNRPEHAWGPRLRQFAGNEAAARGVRVSRGEHIAYVGNSGNADVTAPHLHFEIRKPASSVWQAPAVNPESSLRNATSGRAAEDYQPFTTAEQFVTRAFRDLLGRTPAAADVAYYSGEIESRRREPQWLLAFLLASDEAETRMHSVTRLYRAFFLRDPDLAGFDHWVGRRRNGSTPIWIADFFAGSDEFRNRYGTLDDGAFVDLVYQNVLGRAPDAEGRAHWVDALARGRSRGWVMVNFSESPEYIGKTRRDTHIIGAYGSMVRRMPTPDELANWRPVQNIDMVHMLRMTGQWG